MLRTTHAADHPIAFAEGAYLKTIFMRVTAGAMRGRASTHGSMGG